MLSEERKKLEALGWTFERKNSKGVWVRHRSHGNRQLQKAVAWAWTTQAQAQANLHTGRFDERQSVLSRPGEVPGLLSLPGFRSAQHYDRILHPEVVQAVPQTSDTTQIQNHLHTTQERQMKVNMGTTTIELEPDAAAIVFDSAGAAVYVQNTGEQGATVSDPSLMVAVIATLMGNDNRDLWTELKARFDHNLETHAVKLGEDLTQRVTPEGFDVGEVMKP